MIRRVTRVDVIRANQGQGQPGSYQLELELDDGADQYLLTPSGEDINTVLRLFHRSGGVLFDQRTEELTFESYGAAGG
jgi:hypothetical protein